MRRLRVLTVIVASGLAGVSLYAQVGRGGSEWLTAYADAQRTSWIRTDPQISVATMSKPGFELQWTSKLDNTPRQLNGLLQGVSANGVTLFVPMSIVSASSNTVYGIDNDTGYVVWKRRFEGALPAASANCPGGITSAATRIVPLVPPPLPAPRTGGAGRAAQGYRSMVGRPGEGVPVDANGVSPGRGNAPPPAPNQGRGNAPAGGNAPAAAAQARGPAPTAGIPGAPAETPATGLARVSGVAYAIAADGQLHVVGLPSGKDIQKPAPFLPANARVSDAIAINTTLYAATSRGCGSAPNGVWAIDLEGTDKPVTSWKTNGGSVVGAVAFGSDGTLFAAIGPGQATGDGKANAIVALDPRTLALKDWFAQPSAAFVTGPMIFRQGAKDIVAAGTRDGRILLLDGAALGGRDHATPLVASAPVFAAGGAFSSEALATWQELTIAAPPPGGPPNAPAVVTPGTRWILAPVSGALAAGSTATNGAISTGAVRAFKLVDTAGTLSLEAGWTSANLSAPATPITVNGVVFALSTGRPASAAGRGSAATLYAYEGTTGKPLWNSGAGMKTFASPGSFWSALGQVYVGTHDGTLHAFGFLDERR